MFKIVKSVSRCLSSKVQIGRTFRTCPSVNASIREGKFMVKIMTGSAKPKKRHWYTERQGSQMLDNAIAPAQEAARGGKVNLRRLAVLNKVFMRHITDQMSSSELISGKGVQITRVQMSEDFRVVNVYWLSDTSVKFGAFLQTLLDNYSHVLRNQLSQLRIIGRVPAIKFVSDKQRAIAVDVERLLNTADVGDDEEEISTLYTSQPSRDVHHIHSDSLLPPMRNDVFGLHQADIMTKIRKALKKRLAREKMSDEKNAADSLTAGHNVVNAEIAKFCEHRETQRSRKKHKENLTCTQELGVEEDCLEDAENDFEDYEEQDRPFGKD